MYRLDGQDAVFLYRETPAAMMHTLKVHLIKPLGPHGSVDEFCDRLEQTILANPFARLRIVPVPFGLHHPLMVEDPDFDIGAHIFRAAIPAPGGMRELDAMVAQIGGTLLSRSRPLWEAWVLEGLDSGHIAVVHKLHHSMADGMAYVGQIKRGWQKRTTVAQETVPTAPLPGATRLIWDALADHVKQDVWKVWPLVRSFTGHLRELRRRDRLADEPRINPLTADFPRLRFNRALGIRRSFASGQLSLAEIKSIKQVLGVTLNDVVLAIVAGALRSYLSAHDELPDAPLAVSIPVGADDPGAGREIGNRVTALMSMLHTEIADPVERLHAIKADTEKGKQDLAVFGKQHWGELMQYVPPALMSWSCRRKFRLKPANRENFRPNCNIVISNVPGPRERLGDAHGELEAIYSVGVLGEGLGLNVTFWSYMDQLNIGILACNKAVPDVYSLLDAIPESVRELSAATQLCQAG